MKHEFQTPKVICIWESEGITDPDNFGDFRADDKAEAIADIIPIHKLAEDAVNNVIYVDFRHENRS